MKEVVTMAKNYNNPREISDHAYEGLSTQDSERSYEQKPKVPSGMEIASNTAANHEGLTNKI
jgi:hypothetical protein